MIHDIDPNRLVQRFYDQPMGSVWVRYQRVLAMYVRKRPCFTLANISITSERRMGKGILTGFLDAVEPNYELKFENVLNPRLADYLLRRGYVQLDQTAAPSFGKSR